MATEDHAVDAMYSANPESDKVNIHEGESSSGRDVQEMESTMKVLTRVDLDLAYASEKLVNLSVLLMHLLAWDNDPKVTTKGNMYVSETSIEKEFEFNLLFGFIDSELREVDRFADTLQAEVANARNRISSFRYSRELFTIVQEKLHDSEESLKKSQEQILEMKIQLAKLQGVFLAFKHENWNNHTAINNGTLSNINANVKMQAAEQQRYILSMLEKSLARELDLERKLSELRQNEEQLKLKIHYMEQVAFHMEEAAEVVWGRFLEAENASEVLMGISKEMVGRLQIVQFNLNGSVRRETEIQSKLQDCIEQLKAKDTALQNFEDRIAGHVSENPEVFSLRERVKSLEEQLKESELRLKSANAFNNASQEQLTEIEDAVETLKESMYEAESRAESAETKVTQLTDTNLELTEERNFLKGSNNGNTKKVSLLETQVRELENQLQHAKASSDASQEQQNMLYSAIWDMETLIEDLKSKVSKAESKTEIAEEQCIVLSETNLELNKEINFLRDRVEDLETSLDQANNSKVASAKEINLRMKLITDLVMQLGIERERIQKQLYSLTKENEKLAKKLQNTEKDVSETISNDVNGDDKTLLSSKNDSSNATTCTNTSEEAISCSKSFQNQVDEPSMDTPPFETEVGPSVSANDETDAVSEIKTVKTAEAKHFSLMYVINVIFVSVISVLAIYFLHKKVFFHIL